VAVTVAVTVTYRICIYDELGVTDTVEVPVEVIDTLLDADAVTDGLLDIDPLTEGLLETDPVTDGLLDKDTDGVKVCVRVPVIDDEVVRDGVWLVVAITDLVTVCVCVIDPVGVMVGVGDGMSVSRTIIFTPENTTDISVVH
jgi:hypothetical protein